jgi:hypothetical protein
MPVIRKPQWDALVRAFLLTRVSHIQEALGARHGATFARLGQATVRERIEYGVEKACKYGIEDQAGATLLVNLMFTYGDDFDVEQKTRWAGVILGQHSVPIAERLRDLEAQAEAVEEARREGLVFDDDEEPPDELPAEPVVEDEEQEAGA